VTAPFELVRFVGSGDVAGGRGGAGDEVVDGEIELRAGERIAHGGERIHVGDEGLDVAIAHFREALVGHHGEQRAAVAADAFADGADLFAVGPGANARFDVGGDVGRDDVAGEAEFLRELPSTAAAARDYGRGEFRKIAFGVAAVAIGQDGEEVFAAGNVFRCHGHLDGLGGEVIGRAQAEITEARADDCDYA